MRGRKGEADDERVSAWVSTPEYIEGSERVFEMQRRNQAR